MALDTDKIKKDLGIITNLNPITRLIKMLMERYQITEKEAIDMIQRGGQGPELEPFKPGQMPEEKLPRRPQELSSRDWGDKIFDRDYMPRDIEPPKMWPEREPDRGWPTGPRDDIPYDFMPREIEPSFDRKKYYEDLNKGGRVGYQTGGLTEQRQLPPEYVEALGKTYAADLTRQAGIPSITTAVAQQPGETAEQFAQRQAQAQQFGITKAGMADLAPTVAAQDALQTAAYTQATDPTIGLGAYQPYLTKAATAADAATALTGPMTTAQTTAYMSPYQQQVIDATMTEFDAQAQIRENQRAAAALGIPGAYGGGREGVQKAVYQTESDRNRAALLAQLRETGFQQAKDARQQDFANQQALATQQRGLGAAAQDFGRAQIAGLGGLGAAQQAQEQAKLDASRQFAQMAVQEPRQRLDMLGSGVMGLMGGMGGTRLTDAAPQQSSPLGTALGYGLMGADIYGRIFS